MIKLIKIQIDIQYISLFTAFYSIKHSKDDIFVNFPNKRGVVLIK